MIINWMIKLWLLKIYVLPAANAFSLPVTIIAPILSLVSNFNIASFNSVINFSQRAFKAFGLFKVIKPIFFFSPAVSTLMNS